MCICFRGNKYAFIYLFYLFYQLHSELHFLSFLVSHCMFQRPFWQTREHWMTYREPDFHSVVWFGSSPTPSPLSRQPVVFLSLPVCCQSSVGEEPSQTTPRKPGPLSIIEHSMTKPLKPQTEIVIFKDSDLWCYYKTLHCLSRHHLFIEDFLWGICLFIFSVSFLKSCCCCLLSLGMCTY